MPGYQIMIPAMKGILEEVPRRVFVKKGQLPELQRV